MRVLIAIAIGFVVTIALSYGLIYYAKTANLSGLAPKEEAGAGERLVELIRTRRFAAAMEAVDPSIRQVDPAVLEKMAGFFPRGAISAPRVTNWTRKWQGTAKAGNSTFEDVALLQLTYAFDGGTGAAATIAFDEAGGRRSIIGVNIVPRTPQQMHITDFPLTGLGPSAVAILALAIAIDTLAFAAFALALMGPGPSWKTRWLWALLALLGLVRVNVVWITGQIAFLPISFMLPPMQLSQMPMGTPWVIGMSLPVGAVVYLAARAARGWGRPEEDHAAAAARGL